MAASTPCSAAWAVPFSPLPAGAQTWHLPLPSKVLQKPSLSKWTQSGLRGFAAPRPSAPPAREKTAAHQRGSGTASAACTARIFLFSLPVSPSPSFNFACWRRKSLRQSSMAHCLASSSPCRVPCRVRAVCRAVPCAVCRRVAVYYFVAKIKKTKNKKTKTKTKKKTNQRTNERTQDEGDQGGSQL